MIEIKGLSKFYGSTRVLTNINLKLEENKIYGLLGRNGVGKTTLLNIISNQINKNSGEVKLYGEEIYENSKDLEKICIVKEKGFGVDDIKVKRILK
ncbi:ABC-2 type transport system ATP-binding protein [Proteiniborus sp. DW1]|uniref:ATP-binding cassette domain-containing protein n=1 Tax=Proteiniborus sp. DW1 TaxID=1889883 RepID=UPI00092DFB7F|nr:ATP-binding cassette domain-containing protein [Proteiniborus sp. DW1]SCG84430.1 ABC-2 type transport system ATP-binding protein [Proteiniborus sp. DW1]